MLSPTLAFFGIIAIPGLQAVGFKRVGVQFACVVAGRADQLVAVAAHSYAHAARRVCHPAAKTLVT